MIYRREITLKEFIHIDGWDNLYKAYLSGDVLIQPELNLWEDTKIPVALSSDPFIRSSMPSALLDIFPKANIFPDSLTKGIRLGEESYTLNQIIGMPSRSRNYIVKYAGPSLKYGFGGRAVYRLRGMSRGQAKEVIEYAIDQVRRGHVWMIQELNATRHELGFLDKVGDKILHSDKLYSRYMFYYFDYDEGVKLVNASSTLRQHWKAVGAEDSIVAPLRVLPNAKVKYLDREGITKLRKVYND